MKSSAPASKPAIRPRVGADPERVPVRHLGRDRVDDAAAVVVIHLIVVSRRIPTVANVALHRRIRLDRHGRVRLHLHRPFRPVALHSLDFVFVVVVAHDPSRDEVGREISVSVSSTSSSLRGVSFPVPTRSVLPPARFRDGARDASVVGSRHPRARRPRDDGVSSLAAASELGAQTERVGDAR